MNRSLRPLTLLGLLLLVLSACGQAAPAAQPAAPAGGEAAPAAAARKICFAFQDLETEFWVAGHTAITQTLREQGVEVIERNANQDANKQLEQIKDCITQGVDGIIMIPQDGQSAVTIIGEANKADVPIVIFNRPPAADNPNNAIVVVADNHSIALQAMEHMALEAEKLGRKVQPLILVGDLGDPNAVERKRGFDDVIAANPDLFETPIEVPTKWDANTALANLQNALQANPNVDLIFTSSDFLYPQIRSVLEPLGKWKPLGEDGHIILGGIDGDSTACNLMRDGYVDATGVQDLFFEAEASMSAVMRAISTGEAQPNETIADPGFALTQANMAEREMDMWGCKLSPRP